MAIFQKRHYEAIAETIKESATYNDFKQNLLRLFSNDNERFDTEKFIIASIPEESKTAIYAREQQ